MRRDTLAIGRIHHQDARFRSLCVLLEGHRLQRYIFAHACSSHILHRDVDGLLRDVRPVAHEIEATLLAIVVVDAIEQFLIIIDPLLESELLAFSGASVCSAR